jgi:hypothetical protein
LVARVATVLLLALAALLIGADAGEYPGYSCAGLRALAHGALPLLAIGTINLYAVRAGRIARSCAVAANLVLLYVALTLVHREAPPFFWMLVGAAFLLVLSSAGLLWAGARRAPVS